MSARETPGQLLRKMRAREGWSQGELAKRAGVTQSTVSDLETGKIEFSLHYANIFAPVFGIAVRKLAEAIGIPERLGLADPDPDEARLRREQPELFAMLARLQALTGPERDKAIRSIIRVGNGFVDDDQELRRQYDQQRDQRSPAEPADHRDMSRDDDDEPRAAQ